MARRRRVGSVPALRLSGTWIKRRERHHRELRGSERSVEALVNGLAFPTALRPLGAEARLNGAGQMLISFGTPAGDRERKNGVI